MRKLIFLAMLALLAGCVAPHYEYGASSTRKDYRLPDGESQIERGRENKFIDGVGWVVGIPTKIMLLNAKMDNHNISPQTEQELVEYLEKNDLDCVKVRLNQYDPVGEWKRLTKNTQVSAGWRYTAGTLSLLGYTLLPGRIIGGDNYNPFTNTINLYSDHPAVALHEAGHAKDFGQQEWKGTYGVAYSIPVYGLLHEARATNDALSYMEAEGKYDLQADAYKVLYPAYGSHVGGQFSNFIPAPASWAIMAGCVIPGHIAGRAKANEVEETQLYSRRGRSKPSDSGIRQAGHEEPARSRRPVDE